MKKIKEIDLDDIFPHVSETTKGTSKIWMDRSLDMGGGGNNNEYFPFQIEWPRVDRWAILKHKIRRSVLLTNTDGEEFRWVEASSENPEYIQLGLFSAAFFESKGNYQIVFRRYVSRTPRPLDEYEYWSLIPIDQKIPYWEVNSENFSTWTDEGICFIVKSKLQRMYQTEVENVL